MGTGEEEKTKKTSGFVETEHQNMRNLDITIDEIACVLLSDQTSVFLIAYLFREFKSIFHRMSNFAIM